MAKLLRYYCVISALAFVLTVVGLASAYRYFSIHEMLVATEQRNVEYARVFANELWPDLAPLLSADIQDHNTRIADLSTAARSMAEGSPILKIKFYGPDGHTVFSSDPAQIGEMKALNAGLLTAVRDTRANSEMTARERFSAFSGELFDRDVVETYVPITRGGDTSKAVIELYTDVTALTDRIWTTTYYIVGLTAGLLSLLYFLMFWIVSRAGHSLELQYEALEKSEASLRHAHHVLEKASEMKSMFLRTVSHELRTPLNAIIGFSDVLVHKLYGPLGHKKYEEYATDIHFSSAHLLGLINNLLDLSSIEAGRRKLALEHVDTVELIGECEVLLAEQASDKKVELQFNIATDLPAMYVDHQALRQILINLLSNAIKFSPVGGIVAFASSFDGTAHKLAVSDSGPGIPNELLSTVTEPFVTTAEATTSTEGGTGLGLSIVKALVELHEGTVSIDCAPGRGTVATIILPLRTHAAA